MSNTNPRKLLTYTPVQIQQLLTAVHDGAVDACIVLADAAATAGTPAADIGTYIDSNRPLIAPSRDGSGTGILP